MRGLTKCDKRHEVNKCTDRLAQCRVATNFQFVKNTISAKYSKVKHNKMRYACIYCYVKIPQIKWLKIHKFVISFCGSGIQAQLICVLYFRVSYKPARCWLGLGLIWRSDWLTDMVVGRIQFFKAFYTERLCSLQAVGHRLPSVPCHMDQSDMAACFIKTSKRDSFILLN